MLYRHPINIMVRNYRRGVWYGELFSNCGITGKGKNDKKKFLGANYEVDASNGHVRDLPKSQMGIDVEHDFDPKYITIRGKGDILAKLRKEVKKADKIYLATDLTGKEKRFPGI